MKKQIIFAVIFMALGGAIFYLLISPKEIIVEKPVQRFMLPSVISLKDTSYVKEMQENPRYQLKMDGKYISELGQKLKEEHDSLKFICWGNIGITSSVWADGRRAGVSGGIYFFQDRKTKVFHVFTFVWRPMFYEELIRPSWAIIYRSIRTSDRIEGYKGRVIELLEFLTRETPQNFIKKLVDSGNALEGSLFKENKFPERDFEYHN